jgi:Tetratricopeptide repeat
MSLTDSFLGKPRRLLFWIGFAAAHLFFFAPADGSCQAGTCSPVAAHAPTPADEAYGDGDYATAEQLYTQALAQEPNNGVLAAALVHTLLHEDKEDEAAQRVQTMLAANPRAAETLSAEAEVELRQGLPWQAMQTLDRGEDADHCDARLHLIRSRALRIDSMYASERAELQKAYEIDPTDPDIQNAWHSTVSTAQEIESTLQSLELMKDLDAATRQKAGQTVHDLMPLLSENSQTCKVLPSMPSVTLPLLPSREDGKTIDGFRIEAQLPKDNVKLQVDTASSGLYITRELAEENGLHQGDGDPQGTVRLDSLRIGPLEFRDCLVGVSATPFASKADGFVGTDIFASYLIRIDPHAERLTLSPLPELKSVVPGDRPTLPELAAFTPVYHRRQYLLVPVTLDNKTREIFVLDTGMRVSTMTPEIAHSLSNLKMNFTNMLQTASGPAAHVYRDTFDFQFAHLAFNRQNHILEFEPSAIDHNAGLDVGGLLGFDMLHLLTLDLDYRDGLVRFDTADSGPRLEARAFVSPPQPGPVSASAGPAPSAPAETTVEASDNDCAHDNADRPLNATLEGTIQIAVDSGHSKPGKEVWVKTKNGYSFPGCTLIRDAVVYGRVVSASSKKNSDTAELSLAFDRGDCRGHGKQQISLRLIGIVAPPPDAGHLHEMLPTEVVGGARQISDTAAATGGYDPKPIQTLAPAIVHPGVVVGMPHLKLEPAGGPGCSSRIVSTKRSVELNEGVELILAAYGTAAK